jgi:hypothetical protein
LFVGLFAFAYLVNPTVGLIEILPDNLAFLGNMDEATATAVLIGVFRYFGVDLAKFFERKRLREPQDK